MFELALGSKPTVEMVDGWTGCSSLNIDMLCIHNHTLIIYYIICIIIILHIACYVYFYLITMRYIDMLSNILHDISFYCVRY